MMQSIAKNEGVAGLYAGVTPAIARHIPYTGFRAIGYEYIRAFFCGDKPKEQVAHATAHTHTPPPLHPTAPTPSHPIIPHHPPHRRRCWPRWLQA